jgi:hypothetical protein
VPPDHGGAIFYTPMKVSAVNAQLVTKLRLAARGASRWFSSIHRRVSTRNVVLLSLTSFLHASAESKTLAARKSLSVGWWNGSGFHIPAKSRFRESANRANGFHFASFNAYFARFPSLNSLRLSL